MTVVKKIAGPVSYALVSIMIMATAGCAMSTKMVNDKGNVVECKAAGVGPVTGMAAQTMHDSCVSSYKAQGYKEAS
jgi:hypothetical protein